MIADATHAKAAACLCTKHDTGGYGGNLRRRCNTGLPCLIHVACSHLLHFPNNNASFNRSAGCVKLLALTVLVSKLLRPLSKHAGELVMVLHWSLINYSAIVKILKKHDKRSGVLLRAPYLANVLTQVGALGRAGRGVGLGRPGKGQ